MDVAEILKNAGLPENPTDIIGRKFWAEGNWDDPGGGESDLDTPTRTQFGGIITGLTVAPERNSDLQLMLTVAPVFAFFEQPKTFLLGYEVEIFALNFWEGYWRPSFRMEVDGETTTQYGVDIPLPIRLL